MQTEISHSRWVRRLTWFSCLCAVAMLDTHRRLVGSFVGSRQYTPLQDRMADRSDGSSVLEQVAASTEPGQNPCVDVFVWYCALVFSLFGSTLQSCDDAEVPICELLTRSRLGLCAVR